MQSSIAESNNNIKSTDQKLLDIFIENMKEDYGRLLEKNCTDLELLKWCGRKKFYQQALTVIESRIPGFLEGKIYTFEVEMKDENSNVLSRKKIMKRIKPRKWEKDCNYLLEQWCYQKIVKEGTDSDKFMELDKKGAQQFWNDMKESWNGDEKSKYEFQLEDPKFRQNSKIKKLQI